MKQVGKIDIGPTEVWGGSKKVTMGETQEAMVRQTQPLQEPISSVWRAKEQRY